MNSLIISTSLNKDQYKIESHRQIMQESAKISPVLKVKNLISLKNNFNKISILPTKISNSFVNYKTESRIRTHYNLTNSLAQKKHQEGSDELLNVENKKAKTVKIRNLQKYFVKINNQVTGNNANLNSIDSNAAATSIIIHSKAIQKFECKLLVVILKQSNNIFF